MATRPIVVVIDSDKERRVRIAERARRGLVQRTVTETDAMLPTAALGTAVPTPIVCVVHDTDIGRLIQRGDPLQGFRADLGNVLRDSSGVLIRHTRTWDGFEHFETSKYSALTDVACGSDAVEANILDFLEECEKFTDLSAPPVHLLRRQPVDDAASALACLCLGFLAAYAMKGDRTAITALELDEDGLKRLQESLGERWDRCVSEVDSGAWWAPVARDTADMKAFEAELAAELRQEELPGAVRGLLGVVAGHVDGRIEAPPVVKMVADAYEAVRKAMAGER